MPTTDYRRTPLPQDVRTPLGWIALCLVALLFRAVGRMSREAALSAACNQSSHPDIAALQKNP